MNRKDLIETTISNMFFNNSGLNFEAKTVGKDGYTVLDNSGVITPDSSMIPNKD